MRSVGKYRVTGELARGNMGVVYRARDDELGRDVAVKIMRSTLREDPVLLERFRREAEALARLQHPNVLRVHDVGEHEGVPFLVMELIDGESLEDRLRRDGPLTEREAVSVTLSLAEALASAHEHALLHRDIKPDNVVLSSDGSPRLTDFGLARDLEASRSGLTRTGSSLGTPGYWPPEQARGDLSALGPHSDVYGLGATFFAMLIGKSPKKATTVAETLASLNAPPPSLLAERPGLDPRLDAICRQCLEPDPGRRYPTMHELRADLRRYWADEPVLAGGGGGRLEAWVAHNAVAVGIGAAGLVGVALLLVAGLSGDPPVVTPRPEVRRPAPDRRRPVPRERAEELPPYAKRAWELATAKAAEGSHSEALEQFAFLARELHDRPTLVSRLERAASDVHLARARAFVEKSERMSMPREARADFERAIELTPERVEVHVARGTAYWEVAMRSAEFSLLGAKRDGETSAGEHGRRRFGSGAWRREHATRAFEPARDSLRRALALDPEAVALRFPLGSSLYHLGAWAEAGVELNLALAAEADHAEALFCRGLARAALEQDAAAAADFARSQACFSAARDTREAAHQALCYLAAAEVNLRLGNLDQAQADCEGVLHLLESSTDLGGRARRLLGRIEAARKARDGSDTR